MKLTMLDVALLAGAAVAVYLAIDAWQKKKAMDEAPKVYTAYENWPRLNAGGGFII